MSEQSISPESVRPPETEAKADITPAVSHVVLGAIDKNNVNPKTRKAKDTAPAELAAAKPEALKEITEAGNKVSYKSRTAETTDSRALDVKIKEWNDNFWNAATAMAGDKNVPDAVRDERNQALASLGLDTTKQAHDGDQVEQFRQKYVAEDASNIEQFVSDLAEGCKNQGTVDLDRLQARLNAIEPMLSIFGKTDNVNLLVADFAMAHGILAQSEADKSSLAQKAQQEIAKEPSPSEQTRLEALWNEMDKGTEPEVTSEKPPKTESGDLKKQVERTLADAQAHALPIESVQDPNLSNEDRMKSLAMFTTEQEVILALDALQYDDEERTQVIQDLHLKSKVLTKRGAEFTFAIPFAIQEGQVKDMNPDIFITKMPDHIKSQEDLKAFYEMINEELQQEHAKTTTGERETRDVSAELQRLKDQGPVPDVEEYKTSEAAGKSIKDKFKSQKEDTILVQDNLIAAFDGVGSSLGSENGAQASRNFIQAEIQNMPKDLSLEDTQRWLIDLVKRTHQHLFDLRAIADPKSPIGETTVALAYVWNNSDIITVNVGDSNLYSYEDGKLSYLTENPNLKILAFDQLALQELAKKHGSVDGQQLDLAQYAKDNGVSFDTVLNHARRYMLETQFSTFRNTTQDKNPTLEAYAKQQGVDIASGLQSDAAFTDMYRKLFPDSARIMGKDFEKRVSFAGTGLTADGKLDVSQPLESKLKNLVTIIAQQNENAQQELREIQQAILNADQVGDVADRIQRMFNNLDADAHEVPWKDGKTKTEFGPLYDTETGKQASELMAALFERRNILDQALGSTDDQAQPREIKPQSVVKPINPEKRTLLLACTDGVDDNLTEAQIEAALKAVSEKDTVTTDDLKDSVDSLVGDAYNFYDTQTGTRKRAKHDDISAALKIVQAA